MKPNFLATVAVTNLEHCGFKTSYQSGDVLMGEFRLLCIFIYFVKHGYFS